jgi:hypothetical protein
LLSKVSTAVSGFPDPGFGGVVVGGVVVGGVVVGASSVLWETWSGLLWASSASPGRDHQPR